MNLESGNFNKQENKEISKEVLEDVAEKREKVREQLEKRAEKESNKKEQLEKARYDVEKIKREEEDTREENPPKEFSPAERRAKVASAHERKVAYKRTMKETQDQLGIGSRTFSKVIHNPVVEKTSETVGGTIARPNAILSGSVFAFLLTTAVLIISSQMGYTLSGFESIGAFILGWIIGLTYDYFRVLIKGRSR